MAVRLVEPRDPRKIPEYVLWTLTKGARRTEARTRMTPAGVELRVFVTRTDGEWDLLWSMIFQDGAQVNEFAQLKQREFEARGWAVEDFGCLGTDNRG